MADGFATSQPEVERVTGDVPGRHLLGGDFDAALDGEDPLLDESERSHMTDVSRLVRLLAGILSRALRGGGRHARRGCGASRAARDGSC